MTSATDDMVQTATEKMRGVRPDRFAGDGKNDPRAVVAGYWWASWDNGNRSVTTSWLPNGDVLAAGWARDGSAAISFRLADWASLMGWLYA